MKIRVMVVFTIIIYLLSGCNKREICEFSHPHQGKPMFSFDWQHLFSGTDMPRHVSMHFYPTSNDTVIRYVSMSTQDNLRLPADTYQLLIFNEDITAFDFEQLDDFHAARVKLQSLSGGNAGSASPLYGCTVRPFVVKPDQETKPVFTLQRYSHRIAFSLRINGLFSPVSCLASLSGLSASLLLSTGQIDGGASPVTAVFPLDVTDGKASGTLYTLGKANREANLLTLKFTMDNGLIYSANADISEALEQITNKEIDISLLINGDEISGITATVTAWVTGEDETVVIP